GGGVAGDDPLHERGVGRGGAGLPVEDADAADEDQHEGGADVEDDGDGEQAAERGRTPAVGPARRRGGARGAGGGRRGRGAGGRGSGVRGGGSRDVGRGIHERSGEWWAERHFLYFDNTRRGAD